MADENKPLSAFRTILLIFMMLTFVNFFWFAWSTQYDESSPVGSNILKERSDNAVIWVPLEAEKALYTHYGYDISWTEGRVWSAVRRFLGPWSAFLEMLVLRLFGLLYWLPMLVAVLMLAGFEGRIRYAEKVSGFQNVSSTRYHLFVQAIFGTMALVSGFITFPFGADVPFVGTIPIVHEYSILGYDGLFWLSSPGLATAILSIPFFITVYQVSSNLAKNI